MLYTPNKKDRFQPTHSERKAGSCHSKAAEAAPGCPFGRHQGQMYLWGSTEVTLVQNPLGCEMCP